MECKKCSFENGESAKFCVKCGTSLVPEQETVSGNKAQRKSRKKTIIIFVVLLALGVGIFYFVKGRSSIKMVSVKGGTFRMGSTSGHSDEKPVHSVTLSNFRISKYEVTQKQWKDVMGSNTSYFKGDNLPVEDVSWNEVQTFIRKLNAKTGKKYRLPTESAWEFAARGGNKSRGYKYSGSNTFGDVAWYVGNSGGKTHPVGTKAPNELGIYDMSGNVSEWCSDWFDDYSSSSQTNTQGPSSGSFRVYRGGSWRNDATDCRTTSRSISYPSDIYYNLGFRLVSSF